MQTNRTRRGLVMLGLTGFLALAASTGFAQSATDSQAATDQKADAAEPKSTSAAELPLRSKLAATLNEQVQFRFLKTPLPQVAQTLSKQLGIPVVVRRPAFVDKGIDPDEMQISMEVSGIRLRSFLTLLTRESHLEAVITDEAIVLTTPDDAARIHFTRIYDLSALPDALNSDWIGRLVRSSILPGSWAFASGQTAPSPAYRNNDIAHFPTSTYSSAPSNFMATKATPQHDPKAGIEFLGRRLIVTHSQEGHRQVQNLLQELQDSYLQSTGQAVSPIEAALHTPVDLDLVNVSLAEFLKVLQEKIGHNIILKTMPPDSEAGVTLIASQISPSAALPLVLEAQGMDYFIEHEVIVVDSLSTVRSQRVTKLYPTTDRLSSYPPEQLTQVISQCIEPQSWSNREYPFDSASYVGPGDSGVVEVVDGYLVITHNPPTQRKVSQLLKQLQEP